MEQPEKSLPFIAKETSMTRILTDLKREIDASFKENLRVVESCGQSYCNTLQSHRKKLVLRKPIVNWQDFDALLGDANQQEKDQTDPLSESDDMGDENALVMPGNPSKKGISSPLSERNLNILTPKPIQTPRKTPHIATKEQKLRLFSLWSDYALFHRRKRKFTERASRQYARFLLRHFLTRIELHCLSCKRLKHRASLVSQSSMQKSRQSTWKHWRKSFKSSSAARRLLLQSRQALLCRSFAFWSFLLHANEQIAHFQAKKQRQMRRQVLGNWQKYCRERRRKLLRHQLALLLYLKSFFLQWKRYKQRHKRVKEAFALLRRLQERQLYRKTWEMLQNNVQTAKKTRQVMRLGRRRRLKRTFQRFQQAQKLQRWKRQLERKSNQKWRQKTLQSLWTAWIAVRKAHNSRLLQLQSKWQKRRLHNSFRAFQRLLTLQESRFRHLENFKLALCVQRWRKKNKFQQKQQQITSVIQKRRQKRQRQNIWKRWRRAYHASVLLNTLRIRVEIKTKHRFLQQMRLFCKRKQQETATNTRIQARLLRFRCSQALKTWKTGSQQQRKRRGTLRKCVFHLRQRLFSRFFHRWRRFQTLQVASQVNSQLARRHSELRSQRNLHRRLVAWQQRSKQSQERWTRLSLEIQMMHFENQLKRTLSAWKVCFHRQKHGRTFRKRKESHFQRRVLEKWREHVRKKARHAFLVLRFTALATESCKKHVFHSLRVYMTRSRWNKSQKWWEKWVVATRRSKNIQRLLISRTRKLLRASFFHWRRVRVMTLAVVGKSQEAKEKYMGRLFRRCFCRWKLRMRCFQQAEEKLALFVRRELLFKTFRPLKRWLERQIYVKHLTFQRKRQTQAQILQELAHNAHRRKRRRHLKTKAQQLHRKHMLQPYFRAMATYFARQIHQSNQKLEAELHHKQWRVQKVLVRLKKSQFYAQTLARAVNFHRLLLFRRWSSAVAQKRSFFLQRTKKMQVWNRKKQQRAVFQLQRRVQSQKMLRIMCIQAHFLHLRQLWRRFRQGVRLSRRSFLLRTENKAKADVFLVQTLQKRVLQPWKAYQQQKSHRKSFAMLAHAFYENKHMEKTLRQWQRRVTLMLKSQLVAESCRLATKSRHLWIWKTGARVKRVVRVWRKVWTHHKTQQIWSHWWQLVVRKRVAMAVVRAVAREVTMQRVWRRWQLLLYTQQYQELQAEALWQRQKRRQMQQMLLFWSQYVAFRVMRSVNRQKKSVLLMQTLFLRWQRHVCIRNWLFHMRLRWQRASFESWKHFAIVNQMGTRLLLLQKRKVLERWRLELQFHQKITWFSKRREELRKVATFRLLLEYVRRERSRRLAQEEEEEGEGKMEEEKDDEMVVVPVPTSAFAESQRLAEEARQWRGFVTCILIEWAICTAQQKQKRIEEEEEEQKQELEAHLCKKEEVALLHWADLLLFKIFHSWKRVSKSKRKRASSQQ